MALVVSIATAGFLRYVWPTPYAYEHMDGLLIRLHRTNNRVDVLAGDGWHALTPENPLADLAAQYHHGAQH